MKKYSFTSALLLFSAGAVIAVAHYMTTGNTATYIARTPVISSQVPSVNSASISTSSLAPLPPAPTPVVATSTQPSVTATAYIVGNVATGEVYLSQDATWASPIASISKLFTALVASTTMNPEQTVTVTQPMLDAYSDSYGFSLGEQLTLGEVIPSMLIESNNNLAEGLAMTYGYASFIQKMNLLAKNLGLTRTTFMDASGLSNGNISDAKDLFTFARNLYANHKDLLAITATPSYFLATTTEHNSHIVMSTDPFVGDPHLIGGKTGRTDAAGETMMTIFNYNLNGKNYPIAVIVLHSAQGERQIDSERLLFQAFDVIEKQNS